MLTNIYLKIVQRLFSSSSTSISDIDFVLAVLIILLNASLDFLGDVLSAYLGDIWPVHY